MKILKVTDPAFTKYGRIVDNVDFSGLVEALKNTPCPEGVVYEPSIAELEALPVYEELSKVANVAVPKAIEEIKNAPIRHDHICEKDQMVEEVKKFLQI